MRNYHVKTSPIKNKPGTWDSTLVEIYLDNNKIGEYVRNYPSFERETFHPFEQNGREYALYSKDYTATRVMRLPSCEDLCGEERDTWGFCPVEFYVPPGKHYHEPEEIDPAFETSDELWHEFEERIPRGSDGKFGFVAGTIWGDDSSWKIQFLDLSRIEEGILIRSDRFGYIQLPHNKSLKDVVKVCINPNYVTITHSEDFCIHKNYSRLERELNCDDTDSDSAGSE